MPIARIMGRMASEKREDIREQDITGLKYFDKLLPLFARLHEVGVPAGQGWQSPAPLRPIRCADSAVSFQPVVTSLRALQQASELRNVQRKRKCPRASLSSLSEATEVFEPELLQEIIAEDKRLPTPFGGLLGAPAWPGSTSPDPVSLPARFIFRFNALIRNLIGQRSCDDPAIRQQSP